MLKIVYQQGHYYQVMECVIDWLIKVSMRVPMMRQWMQENDNEWTWLIEWLKLNKSPPTQNHYGNRTSSVVLYKSGHES